jgi:hypothetical protein
MRTTHENAHLDVLAFLLGEDPAGHVEARLAFDESFGQSGPDDVFDLTRAIRPHYDSLEPEHLVSLIRMSRHDPKVLRDCFPALSRCLAGAADAVRRDAVRAALRVWENDYPIGEDGDLASEIGDLLYAAGAWEDALPLFQESALRRGGGARAHWNTGLCHFALGHLDRAARCFAEARAHDPSFRPRIERP